MKCLSKLNLTLDNNILNTRAEFLDSRKRRSKLRDIEFKKWCDLPQEGKGVILFEEHPPTNRWIIHHEGLSCSEWRDALKMVGNVATVRALPGRSLNNTRCRLCPNEKETLAHVLRSCPYGDTWRNSRHHKIRAAIAQALRNTGLTVFEEIHGISKTGSTRQIDIAFKDQTTGYIIDPTVRLEYCKSQPDVNEEKNLIYRPTIPYYSSVYKLINIKIISLLVGARRTITENFVQFTKTFNLNPPILKTVSITAVKYSIYILRKHIYAK